MSSKYQNIRATWFDALQQQQHLSNLSRSNSIGLQAWYDFLHQLRALIPATTEAIQSNCKCIYKCYNDMLKKTYVFLDTCKHNNQLNESIETIHFVLDNIHQYTTQKIFLKEHKTNYNTSIKTLDQHELLTSCNIRCYRSDDITDDVRHLPIQMYHKNYDELIKQLQTNCRELNVFNLFFDCKKENIMYPKFKFDEFSPDSDKLWYRALYQNTQNTLPYTRFMTWFQQDRVKYMKCIQQYIVIVQVYKKIIEFISSNYPGLVHVLVQSHLQYHYEDNEMSSLLYDYYSHTVDIRINFSEYFLKHADDVIQQYQVVYNRLALYDYMCDWLSLSAIHQDIIHNIILPFMCF